MAYTAIETMRRKNGKRFGSDVGPKQPPLYTATGGSERSEIRRAAFSPQPL